jgi:hypothetical protein
VVVYKNILFGKIVNHLVLNVYAESNRFLVATSTGALAMVNDY